MGRTRPRSVGWAWPGPKPNGLVTVHQHSNQPLHHLLQNVNYSRSACKCRQGLSKRKQNGAAWGYLGRRRCGAVLLLSRWRDCGGRRSCSFFFLSLLFFFLFFFSFGLQTILPLLLFFFFFRSSPFSPRLLFSSVLFSRFFFFPFFLCFPSLLPLFFFFSFSLSVFSFFFPPFFFVSPVSPVFIGEKRRPTPLPSQWRKGVGWTGRPLFSRPSTTLGTPLLP